MGQHRTRSLASLVFLLSIYLLKMRNSSVELTLGKHSQYPSREIYIIVRAVHATCIKSEYLSTNVSTSSANRANCSCMRYTTTQEKHAKKNDIFVHEREITSSILYILDWKENVRSSTYWLPCTVFVHTFNRSLVSSIFCALSSSTSLRFCNSSDSTE